MKKMFLVYRQLISMNFSALVVYRKNLLNNLLSSVIWSLFTLIQIVLLTSKVTNIYGWSRHELIILACVYSIIIGIFHTVFTRNFEQLSRTIKYGQLDTILVKPIDSHWMVSFSLFHFTGMVRILIGVILLLFFMIQDHIPITFGNTMLFIGCVCFGVSLLYAIWSLVSTSLIWNPQLNNIIDVMFTTSSLSRYPSEMYRQISQYLFLFLLPFTFVAISPTRAILGRATMYDIGGLIIFSFVFVFIANWFWKFALRYYTSASS